MITRLRDVLDPESGLQNLWPDTVSRLLCRILFLFKSLKWLTWVNFSQKSWILVFKGVKFEFRLPFWRYKFVLLTSLLSKFSIRKAVHGDVIIGERQKCHCQNWPSLNFSSFIKLVLFHFLTLTQNTECDAF